MDDGAGEPENEHEKVTSFPTSTVMSSGFVATEIGAV